MKTIAAAVALVALASSALAQDRPARVPTGYEVKGPTCLVQVNNNTYRPANCDAGGRVVDWIALQDSLNNRSTPNRFMLNNGSGESGGAAQ